jgi:hypothetical protein
MVYGGILLPGLFAMIFSMILGYKLGKAYPTWLVRLVAPVFVALGAAAFLFVPAECNPLYSAHPVLNNLLAVFGINLFVFAGTTFVISTIASTNPARNELLKENENKRSPKKGFWLFFLGAVLLAIPGFMLSVVIANKEFQAGHLCIAAVGVILSLMPFHQACAEFRGRGQADPPAWIICCVGALGVIMFLAVFKGWGLLSLLFFFLLIAARARK